MDRMGLSPGQSSHHNVGRPGASSGDGRRRPELIWDKRATAVGGIIDNPGSIPDRARINEIGKQHEWFQSEQ